MNVETIADLAKLRHALGRKAHTDERLSSNVVILTRSGMTCGTIVCATVALAWDALRIAAGLRFRRDNEAALDEPLVLAA